MPLKNKIRSKVNIEYLNRNPKYPSALLVPCIRMLLISIHRVAKEVGHHHIIFKIFFNSDETALNDQINGFMFYK